jgi:hypothetical protein
MASNMAPGTGTHEDPIDLTSEETTASQDHVTDLTTSDASSSSDNPTTPTDGMSSLEERLFSVYYNCRTHHTCTHADGVRSVRRAQVSTRRSVDTVEARDFGHYPLTGELLQWFRAEVCSTVLMWGELRGGLFKEDEADVNS